MRASVRRSYLQRSEREERGGARPVRSGRPAAKLIPRESLARRVRGLRIVQTAVSVLAAPVWWKALPSPTTAVEGRGVAAAELP